MRPTGPLLLCATLAILAIASSCVPPRDSVTDQSCTTNAQCPADGKHYCDTATNTCKPCSGATCPGANAPSSSTDSSQSSSGGTDTATSADTGTSADSTTASTDTAASGTCANRCGQYQESAPCNCDANCDSFDDCCPDYLQLCAHGGGDGTSTDAAQSDTSQ